LPADLFLKMPLVSIGKKQWGCLVEASLKLVSTALFLILKIFRFELPAAGVPWMARKMMLKVTPTVTFTHDEEKWKIEMKSTMAQMTTEFKLGEEFDYSLLKGGKCKVFSSFILKKKQQCNVMHST
jgi:hypothetical protein